MEYAPSDPSSNFSWILSRLFFDWDRSRKGSLSLQDIVNGMDGFLNNDLMANIQIFFTLHDNDKDGSLSKDEVLQVRHLS